MDYNGYYEVLKYCESILKKKTSEIRGLEVGALEKSPRFAEDSEYHSGLGTAIEYMRMMIEEVKNAESRAAAADREGRAHILPSPRENTCGKCGNFTRTPGCGYGECTLRPGLRPYQSRAKCKRYTEKALE